MSAPDPQPKAWDGPEQIAHATTRLRRGRLVAFPTETVYGLGADALDEDAVRRVFEAKGRPATNPLIVHADDAETAARVVTDWPRAARQLAGAFWPGPLTLVLPKAADVPDVVTAGGETVAVRVPDHPLTLALINAFGGPIVGPSANRSGAVSPTTAAHVREAFAADEVYVLDGGPCRRGIESTVLDLTPVLEGQPARVLRLGVIGAEAIAAVLGEVVETGAQADGRPRSPGLVGPHYRPRTPLVVVGSRTEASDDDAVVELPESAHDAAAALYGLVRAADRMEAPRIAVVLDPACGERASAEDAAVWAAIRERLARASAG